ncbi:MAG: glycosyltransferase family protein [Acidobacteriia bacterium]|nr:glycosyltransferase family protein [Terriglobia bacterium]
MKIVAIVQARMGSTRLRGKVLLDLGGETVLARVVKRLSRAALVNEVVVATTEDAADDAIVRECERLGVTCFRGSEDDVLDRYHRAARACGAEAIVRITSDCPLIDPELVDDTIRIFLEERGDYGSNVFPRTFPRGLDTEVFTAAALERAWRDAREPHQREHVTPYFHEHPELFRLVSTHGQTDYSAYRWTLDTAEDLELLRAIYSRLGNRDNFHWREALAVVERKPELAELNAHVMQKSIRGH